MPISNTNSKYLAEALDIAFNAHKGQTDKAGQPYILHPLRLMFSLEDDKSKIVALLHDVIEDTTITIEDLKNKGFPQDIIEAIEALTKQPNETYQEFIERVSNNELAKTVKIADLKDNMNLTRLTELSNKDIERIEKYHKSLNYLQNHKPNSLS
ncbi:GTP pyrophosphokinase [Entomomonas sp. E2T0]|uniref:GTP pyrophosphokinase n=1 Tax=Entomomonas sp. E2T0 TaxID=2930213 RepID=UPI0022283870|nr:GTP pyrophosphokinase [Entomomonas sp. E2T0]UYZ83921.1 GTP pyrophosphokinase [Entomomonas sp. E2T0]